MNPQFKPMLAAAAPELEALVYPVYTSPKYDGIRAMVIDGVLVSRNLKPIPNPVVQAMFGRKKLDGLDGELICGDPTAPDVFRRTTSVMSHTAPPDAPPVRFYVFDDFTMPTLEFWARAAGAYERLSSLGVGNPQHPDCGLSRVAIKNCSTPQEVLTQQELALAAGYEGLMINALGAPYKFGRSTAREGALLKLKLFEDAEAVIIGLEEQLRNENAATKDALGRTKRTTHKAQKTGKGTLGALRVRGLNGTYKGAEFNIGSGMDDMLRQLLWTKDTQAQPQHSPVGKVVKYKYFPGGGKTAPRFPVFLGFRDARDES
jgi:DNA ligase 1